MPFGVAIAAGAVVAGGAAAGAGIVGAQAASSAGAYQRAGQAGAQAIAGNQLNELRSLYNPFIGAGVGATQQIQSLLYSPQQLDNIIAQREAQLLAERPIFQKTPKGRHMEFAWQAAKLDYENKLQAWNQRYNAFKSQANLMRQQTKANAEGMAKQVQESPLYQYQSMLTNRALASQGLLGSQKAIADQGAATANAYGQLFNNLTMLSNQGLQATGAYGNQAAGLSAQLAGYQAGQQQAQAQSSLGQGQAIGGMAIGIGNAINSGISTGLNYNLLSNYYGAIQQQMAAQNAALRTPAQNANIRGAFNGLGLQGGMGMTS